MPLFEGQWVGEEEIVCKSFHLPLPIEKLIINLEEKQDGWELAERSSYSMPAERPDKSCWQKGSGVIGESMKDSCVEYLWLKANL